MVIRVIGFSLDMIRPRSLRSRTPSNDVVILRSNEIMYIIPLDLEMNIRRSRYDELSDMIGWIKESMLRGGGNMAGKKRQSVDHRWCKTIITPQDKGKGLRQDDRC
ncbi:hypothetical protein EVAR_80608_1 [Eumeta japonica]|uniref:Uncharacterized protein n=1 Tax=Eumeta variegata TaxID=151549 RepID=A0A4C1TLH8_EUMVA|nr:hypothetical protein EVAR_80608_1 [Eumeta japonica]